MHEEFIQAVLRCEKCNKPFNKQATLKRHGYYCRKKNPESVCRRRSCTRCASRKARCDKVWPECSRCETEGIKCHYPTNNLEQATDRSASEKHDTLSREWNTALLPTSESYNIENDQSSSKDVEVVRDGTPVTWGPESINLEEQYLHWQDIDVDFAVFQGPGADCEIRDFRSSGLPMDDHLMSTIMEEAQEPRECSILSASIPMTPTAARRSLIQRTSMNSRAQRTANLISHTLTSYLRMMVCQESVPPYIHPRLIGSDIEDAYMEPLHNCMSLLRMISGGIRGSQKLFWKNVRLECERMREEHFRLNNWQLLAALQALSIYIFVRLDEGETADNNLDVLLLTTVVAISQQFSRADLSYDATPALGTSHLERRWGNWIFEESRNRLCLVYQVLNMLVYFEPAEMCDIHTDEVVLGPLPAKKKLWEADNEVTWDAAYQREPRDHTDFALTLNGDLIRVDKVSHGCLDSTGLHKSQKARDLPKTDKNWEHWCSGMDGLGGLVMLAASLVG